MRGLLDSEGELRSDAAAAARARYVAALGGHGSRCRQGAMGGQTGLVSCSYDGTVRFWDLTQPTGPPPCVGIFQPNGPVVPPPPRREGHPPHHLFSCLQFDAELSMLVAGDIHDNSIKRWELGTGAVLRPLPAGGPPARPTCSGSCIDNSP
jgi:hypothetical protein